MGETRKRAGCWKIGCLGCGGAVGLLVLFFALVSFLQIQRESGGRPIETGEATQPVPTIPELRDLIELGEVGEAGERIPLADTRIFESPAVAGALGTIELDLDMGEFEIVAGEAGEGVRVESEYEEDAFRLAEEFLEHEDGTWTYRITMGPRGGMFGMLFRGAGNNPGNRVRIVLPREQPLDIVGTTGLGSTRMELGGLLIRRIDLRAGTGEHQISFDEPLLAPMESLRLDKSLGELRLLRLGNASPAEVSVSQNIGEVTLDLAGPWTRDAMVRVDNGIGEARITAPESARIAVDRARVALGEKDVLVPEQESVPENAPTITLRVEGSIGGIRITG